MADTPGKLKIWEPFLLSIVTIVGMIAGARFVDSGHLPDKQDTSISNANYSGRQVEEIIRFLETKYVGEVSSEELVEKAIRSIMEGLDPHTHYFPPDQVDELEEKTMGHYVGIGVEVMFIEDSLVILYPQKNSPAAKAGVRPGDYVLQIDDVSIPHDSLDKEEIIDLIKGKKGSRLTLKLKSMLGNEIRTVDIVRHEIKVPSVTAAYMLDSIVAYIRLSRFTNSTYREFMDSWEKLATEDKARHLVIDLRDNPGGYLREAVNILSQLFEEEGKILVYTEGKNKERNEYKSTGKVFFPVENVSVLINKNSASASEIIAGCLQDHDRGLIIGTQSYGKGLVQEQYELSNGGTLRMTVSKYYTPSGRLIQKAYDNGSQVDTTTIYTTISGRPVHAGGGIAPDIKVEDDIDWYKPEVRDWMDIISEFSIRYNLIMHCGEIVPITELDRLKSELPERTLIKQELTKLAVIRGKDRSKQLLDYFQSNPEKIYRIAEATLIAYRTGEEGWYRAFNETDPVVMRAKKMVKENPSWILAQE